MENGHVSATPGDEGPGNKGPGGRRGIFMTGAPLASACAREISFRRASAAEIDERRSVMMMMKRLGVAPNATGQGARRMPARATGDETQEKKKTLVPDSLACV